MPKDVSNFVCYHLTNNHDYSSFSPLQAGDTITSGGEHNPFFAYYQKPLLYPVDMPDGRIFVKAMRFMSAIRDNELVDHQFPIKAHQIARHYLMLARELIMEEVRRDFYPTAPSRQTCLWVVHTIQQAQMWQKRIGGRIVSLSLNGTIHDVDAGHLLGDSEPLSLTYERAKAYWEGHQLTDLSEPETLFKGAATVISIL